MEHSISARDLPTEPLDSIGLTSYGNQEVFIMKGQSNWSHCIQEGKENYPADLIDYLGTLPVMAADIGSSCIRSDLADKSESLSTQLTLFYGGTVNVFENVTADKAQMIMSLADGSKSSWQDVDNVGLAASILKDPGKPLTQPSYTFDLKVEDSLQKVQSNLQADATSMSIFSAGKRIQVSKKGKDQSPTHLLVPCQAVVPKALPIARKESLARFLERRRERVLMKAPYQGRGCQGVDGANSSIQMSFNGLWRTSGIQPFGFDVQRVGGDHAMDCDWVTNYVNSKQVSEGESAS